MKTSKLKQMGSSVFAIGVALTNCARAQETIRHYGGPTLSVPIYYGSMEFDLDWDGRSDFAMMGDSLCTASIPPYCVSTSFTSSMQGTRFLGASGYLAALPVGVSIGSQPVGGTLWTMNSLTIVSYETTLVSLPSPVSPIEAAGGETYCGFSINAEDGIHYGWLRLRLSMTGWLTFVPLNVAIPGPGNENFISLTAQSIEVFDWAYETTPGLAIRAGAVPSPLPVGVGLGSRAGNLRFVWPSENGRAYQLQFKDSLTANVWQALIIRIVATGNTAAAEVDTGGSTRFFQVVRAD